jgi:RNA polymerase sigma factor (sigma-70 family)
MVTCECPPRDCAGLVSRFLAGDRTAGDELARTFKPLVWTIVQRVLGSTRRESWEDATQAVFLKLFSNLRKWQKRCPFCKFVAVVAARHCIDVVRCEKQIAPLPSAEPVDHRAAPVSDALVSRLECVLATFPQTWQLAWRLHCEGVAGQEIAARVDRSSRTVRLWLATIRDRLTQCLYDF